ncbi:MAG: diaminobutyrate--2-oxoglutarate transaminase [Steroidobacteraceae bacterium]
MLQRAVVTPVGLAAPALGAEFARRHNALTQPYTLSSNALLDRQSARESNARSYPRHIPLALKRAEGIYVEDIEGRVFIDCLAGAGTLALGHNHPGVIQAIEQVLKDGTPLHTLDLTTPVKDRFVQDLFDLLPAQFARDAKIQFCGPTGADAVEAALKLVKTATGRSTMFAFQGAYHGMTQGALHLMGNLGPKRALHGSLQDVQFLPFPYDYRCPFGLGGDAGIRVGLHYLQTVLSDPESGVPTPAGLILEIVQGEGGVVPASDEWLRGVRALTAKADVPLIVDEVQTGLGRTGRLFAFEHADIVPDAIVLSKAIGGGLPLSVTIYRNELDRWLPGAHAGTFRGNQMAMAAGSATIALVRAEGLDERAQALGQRFIRRLREIQSHYPQLGDVRGLGLMIGIEVVDPSGERDTLGHPPVDAILARAIQSESLKRGLILELGGRHGGVIRFLPPLIITEAQLDHVVEIFAGATAAAIAGGPSMTS